MAVGPCGDQADRDAARVGGERALQALLPAVDRGPACALAAARGLGDAAVDGYLGQLQADHAVVRLEREGVDGLGNALRGPLFEPSADGAVGASGTGQALVTRAVDQREHHVFEHGPVGNSAAVAAARVPRGELRPCG